MGSKTKHILVVDDIRTELLYSNEILEQAGYSVSLAADADTALDKATRYHTHLILLDVIMPEMNGYELCKILKKNKNTTRIPVIFLTGKTDDNNIQQGIDAGGVDFIHKPFSADELLLRLNVFFTSEHYKKDIQKDADHSRQVAKHAYSGLEDVINYAPEPIIIHQHFEIAYINKAALLLLGDKPIEEIMGSNLLDFFDTTSKKTVKSELDEVDSSQAPPKHTLALKPQNSKAKLVETAALPVHYKDEDSVLLFLHDITRRVKTKQELSKLNTAIEQTHAVIVITDNQANIEYVNQRFIELTGYHPAEVYSKNPRVLQSGKTSLQTYKKLWQTITSGRAWEGVFINKKKNGDEYTERAIITPVYDDKSNITHYIAVKEDITAYKEKEQKLYETQEKYFDIFNNITDIYYKTNEKGIIEIISPSVEKIIGYKPQEVIGQTVSAYYKDPKRRAVFLEELKKHGFVENFEAILTSKNNQEIFVSNNAKAIIDDNNKFAGVKGFVKDITQYKTVLNSLEKKTQEFKEFIENVPIGLYRTTPEGRVIMANYALAKMLGYDSTSELKKVDLRDSLETYQYNRKAFLEEIIEKGEVKGFENQWTKKDGTRIHILENARIVEDENGKIAYFEGSAEDITDKVKTAEKINKIIREQEVIIDNTAIGIAHIKNNAFVWVNDKLCELTKYAKKEIINKELSKIIVEDKKSFSEYDQKDLIEYGRFTKEFQIKDKEGNKLWCGIFAKIIDRTTPSKGSIWIFDNIDQRKKAEQKLQESEKRLRNIIDNIHDAIFIHDFDGNILDVNIMACSRLGYSKEALLTMKPSDFEDKNSRKNFKQNIKKLKDDGYLRAYVTHINKNGKRIPSELQASVIDYKGVKAVISVVRDVTGRIESENELKESKKMLELFFQQPLDGFFFMMLDEPIEWNDKVDREKALDYVFAHQRITRANDAILKQYMLKREEFIGLTPNDFFEHDIDYGKNIWRKFFDDGQLYIVTKERRADGTFIWIEGNYICIYDDDGRITGHFGIQRDVTDKREKESDLEEANEKLQKITDSAEDAIIMVDFNGLINFWNPAAERIFGYWRKEVIGKDLHEIITPEKYREDARKGLEIFKETGRGNAIGKTLELEGMRKDNTIINIELSISVVKIKGQRNAIGIIRDITKKKKAEKALKESEAWFRAMIESTSDWIWELDIKGNYIYASPQVKDILGYEPKEIIGKTPFVFKPKGEAERVARELLDMMRNGLPVKNLQSKSIHKDGTEIMLETNGGPIFDENNKIVGYRGVDRDITERKVAETEIEKSNRSLNALNVCHSAILHINSEPELLKEICEVIIRTLKYKLVWIGYRLFDDNKTLKPVAWAGQGVDYVKNLNISWSPQNSNEIAGKVIQQGEHQFIENLQENATNKELKEAAGRYGFQSIIAVPLNYKDDNIGVMCVYSEQAKMFDSEEIYLLQSIINDVTYAIHSIRSTTHREIAEKALKESEKRYKYLFENSQTGIGLETFDGKIKTSNKALMDILEIENKDLENSNIANHYHIKEDRGKLLKALENSGYVTNFETKLKKKSGTLIDTNINANYIEIEDEPFILVTILDITKRKQAELREREHKEKFQFLSRTAFELIILPNEEEVLDYVGNQLRKLIDNVYVVITRVKKRHFSIRNIYGLDDKTSKSIKEATGFSFINKQHIIPFNTGSIYPNGQLTKYEGTFKDLARRVFKEDEIKTLTKILKVCSIYNIGLYTDNGIFAGIHLLTHNKTVVKEPEFIETFIYQARTALQDIQKERKVLKAKEEAIAANKAKSVFLANMSHEIRTPMNAVLGFSDLLSSTLKDSNQKSYVQSIKSSGKTLLNLINDILDLSKIEAGKMKVQVEPVEIKTVVKEIVGIFSEKARNKSVSLQYDIDKEVPAFVYLDELRVRQILLNLISNAIKFTEEGYIRVKVNLLYKKFQKVDIEIIVEDSGIGIKESMKEKIFDAFQQQDETDSKLFGGTGLGLAITKKLAEMMNGTIILESNEGKGSTFKVIFNELRAFSSLKENKIEKAGQHANDYLFKKSVILIADDVVSNRQLLKGIINDDNIQIFEAENGLEAFEAAKNYKPGLILMDILMPIMDGEEAFDKIKGMDETKDIPIIAITAAAFEEKEEMRLREKFDGFVHKPVTKKLVLDEIAKFIKKEEKVKKPATKSDSFKEITKEQLTLLPQIIDELKTLKEQEWTKLLKRQPIKQVSAFAERIADIGNKYGLNRIESYGNNLLQSIEAFNIEKMRENLEEFPRLIESLEKISNS